MKDAELLLETQRSWREDAGGPWPPPGDHKRRQTPVHQRVLKSRRSTHAALGPQVLYDNDLEVGNALSRSVLRGEATWTTHPNKSLDVRNVQVFGQVADLRPSVLMRLERV